MNIYSFIDVVQSDKVFSKFALVHLKSEHDLFTGEMELYSSNVPDGAFARNSTEEVLKLRDLVTTHLATCANIVLIDDGRRRVFSNIQDPDFLRFAENTDFEFKTIDANRTISKIINKAFPVPEKEERSLRKRCECLLF